jgi:hypothetical protein
VAAGQGTYETEKSEAHDWWPTLVDEDGKDDQAEEEPGDQNHWKHSLPQIYEEQTHQNRSHPQNHRMTDATRELSEAEKANPCATAFRIPNHQNPLVAQHFYEAKQLVAQKP